MWNDPLKTCTYLSQLDLGEHFGVNTCHTWWPREGQARLSSHSTCPPACLLHAPARPPAGTSFC